VRVALPPAVVVLLALHGLALLADPLAPYAPDQQNRELSYAPPTRLHLQDAEGRWHLMPFIYSGQGMRPVPLRLFPRGATYRLAGLLKWDRHLFGVAEPGQLFLLGTDRYGRDVLSRLIVGARLSLFAGLLAAALALGLGIVVGGTAGFYGGWMDGVLTWGINVCLSLPWLYLLLAARSLLPLDLPPAGGFLLTAALIGAVGWARPATLIRAVTLAERERDYVLAAQSCGASNFRLLARHVLPQAVGVLVTQAALMAPRYVLAEITLSFLGLGVSEPTASWGTLTAGMMPLGLVVSHWWLAAPLAAIAGMFALYDRAARELESARD
jgi:peptide/nickel transport system permease protein